MTYICERSCLPDCQNITIQLPTPMPNYFKLLSHSKSTRNKLSIALALLRVRIKTARNVFYYQGAMIYNSLRDIHMQENENLFFKKLSNFNF